MTTRAGVTVAWCPPLTCTHTNRNMFCRMRTLLMYAVSSGSLDTVKAVIRRDPISEERTDVDRAAHRLTVCGFLRRCDASDRSVFHYAAHTGSTLIMTYLFETLEFATKWPEFSKVGSGGAEPLPANSLPETTTKSTVLRHESADVGPSLLYQAALAGHLDMVKCLLSRGACDRVPQPPSDASSSAAQPPQQQDTALICAATSGNAAIIKAIIASGTYDLGARGQFGEAAVHRAAACKHKDALQLLLESGADADAIAEPPAGWSAAERNKLTHYWGGTALLRAAHVGDLERVDMLLEKDCKVCIRESPLLQALHCATLNLVSVLTHACLPKDDMLWCFMMVPRDGRMCGASASFMQCRYERVVFVCRLMRLTTMQTQRCIRPRARCIYTSCTD